MAGGCLLAFSREEHLRPVKKTRLILASLVLLTGGCTDEFEFESDDEWVSAEEESAQGAFVGTASTPQLLTQDDLLTFPIVYITALVTDSGTEY